MKTTTTFVILVCFNVLFAFGQQKQDQKLGDNDLQQVSRESDDWPTDTRTQQEIASFEAELRKRALKYKNQQMQSMRSAAAAPSPVGTCNVITCGSFSADDVTFNNNWGGSKIAPDGSTYGANVTYDCWNDNGTVDYSEGQYISYSNSDANVDTPAIISPSPDGGGFAIFSYQNESIYQDLSVIPNTKYTVCFEIAVIPRYSNRSGNILEFDPELKFGIGSGGVQISDPLHYTDANLNIHPIGDFPTSLSDATTGPNQNPGGWTEIDPYWETVCITFQTDNTGIVNVFYQTGNPGRSVVLIDGLRLSLQGYAEPPKFSTDAGASQHKSVIFCEAEKTDLNDYIINDGPANSVLTWSTNVDPLVTSDHLTDTSVTPPGTYYAFYYNSVDNCASPAVQLDLLVSDFNAQITSKTDSDCPNMTGSIIANGLAGEAPYMYSIDGGNNYQNDGEFANLAVGNYTITVKDANDCIVEVSTIISSIDKEIPTIIAPADYSLEGCDEGDISDLPYSDVEVEITLLQLQNALGGGGDASDDIDIDTITYIDEVTANSCGAEITRTFTITDICGNTASAEQIITVEDTTAPTFVEALPADATVECDEVPVAPTLTATDSCGNANVTYNEVRNDGDCDYNYTLVRTWTATDACGLVTEHVQTLTVQDTEGPAFVEALPADATVECDEVPDAVKLTATDNCSDATVTYNEVRIDGNCLYNYTLERTWTATDKCGNETTHVQTITVQDTNDPKFIGELPASITVECDNVPKQNSILAIDNCGSAVVTFNEVRTDGDCPYNYTLERTWTATDECGNKNVYTQIVNVQDTTAPEFVEALPVDETYECDQDIPDPVVLTATDNCGDAEVVFKEERVDGDCPYNYELVRTWTATDECSNKTTHVQTITVQDTTAPTFVEALPADATVECDAVPTAETLTATDNCGDATVTYNEVRTDGDCPSNYTLERTWTATDACGNETAHTQTITVQDTTAPDFTVPGDIEIFTDADCNYDASVAITGDVTDESDNCSSDLEATFSDSIADGSCEGSYVITRTWTLTDECGNETSKVQTITVSDNTAPEFTVPGDIEIFVDADCNYDASVAITGDVTDESDNCSTGLDATFADSIADGPCEGTYVITRTWSLVDNCGNAAADQIQVITVTDNIAPEFVEDLPADATVECDEVPDAATLTATDNCSDATVTYNEVRTDGDCPSNYTLERTWTATDACGNETAHTQTITVQDTTAPTFVEALPADATVECDAVPTAETLTATDNCEGSVDVIFSEVISGQDDECPSEYQIVRTWSTVDSCGNSTEHVQTINVTDTTAPEFVEELPADAVLECTEVSDPVILTAIDSCSDDPIKVEFNEIIEDGSCASEYTIIRTWTAMDICGNIAEHIQTINVTDTTAPVVTTDFESEIDVLCGEIPDVPQLEFEDACSNDMSVSFTETSTDDGSGSNYTITREWTVSDECENTAVFTQTINVNVEDAVQGSSADLCTGDDFEFDLFELLSGSYGTDGTWEVTSGNTTINGNIFNPFGVELGTYEFTYTDEQSECPSVTTVTISINDECVVLPCSDTFDPDNDIPKAVTPNGDNRNDRFEITGLDDPDCIDVTVHVQIFNRWGAMIYESQNYQNNWQGESSDRSIGNAGKVPNGTYYYIINLKDSSGSRLASYAGPIYVGTK